MGNLVLTGKVGEEFYVGDPGPAQVVITVLEIDGRSVRLSFRADNELPIDRKKIYDKKQAGRTAGGNK